MSKYKVGDRVKTLDTNSRNKELVGAVGIVRYVDHTAGQQDYYDVELETHGTYGFYEGQLELAPKKTSTVRIFTQDHILQNTYTDVEEFHIQVSGTILKMFHSNGDISILNLAPGWSADQDNA